MRKALALVLVSSVVLADTILKNQGTTIGPVISINCGPGTACTRSGSTGTIQLDGGQDPVSGIAPISVYDDGGTTAVSCIPASGVAGGCLTTGTQELSGNKRLDGGLATSAQISSTYGAVAGGFPGCAFLTNADSSDAGPSCAFGTQGRSYNYLLGYTTAQLPSCSGVVGPGGYTYDQSEKSLSVCNGTSWKPLVPGPIVTLANGGTEASNAGVAGAVVYSTSSSFLASAAGSSGQALMSGGTSAPTWGTLGLQYGGTNANLSSPTAGVVAYFTASNITGTAQGSSGQCLKSGGAGAPTWSACDSAAKASGTATINTINGQATDTCANIGSVTVSGATLVTGAACFVGTSFASTPITGIQTTAIGPTSNTVGIYACCNKAGSTCGTGESVVYTMVCFNP